MKAFFFFKIATDGIILLCWNVQRTPFNLHFSPFPVQVYLNPFQANDPFIYPLPCRHTTSFQRRYNVVQHRINVGTTSCVYGVKILENQKFFNVFRVYTKSEHLAWIGLNQASVKYFKIKREGFFKYCFCIKIHCICLLYALATFLSLFVNKGGLYSTWKLLLYWKVEIPKREPVSFS